MAVRIPIRTVRREPIPRDRITRMVRVLVAQRANATAMAGSSEAQVRLMPSAR
jgi:hypothetical protein